MRISCIYRFVQSLLSNTRRSTSHSSIFTITALLQIAKNVSLEVFLGAEFDRDIQNWFKTILEVVKRVTTRKTLTFSRGFDSRAFYAHVRLFQ